MKNVLTIAGSDSGGGAGIQADLKTFSALRVFGMSVITAVTAQNTCEVKNIENLSTEIIADQIDAVYSDIEVDAVKIGMVSSREIVDIIAEKLQEWNESNIVLDPVMISESGHNLLKPDAKESLIKKLFPLSRLVTPNIPEAEAITGGKIENIEDMKKCAAAINKLYAKNVLLKGGHFAGPAVDIFFDGDSFQEYTAERIDTGNTHGAGCTYSSAIASFLARDYELVAAIKKAKKYITLAIKKGLDDLGKGDGPLFHFHEFYDK